MEIAITSLLEQRHAAVTALKEAQANLELIDDQIYGRLKDQVKPIGSSTVEFEGHHVVITIPKTVKWDQSILRSVASRISDFGDDPENYIDYKLAVKETNYKAWPKAIQHMFQPARTVTPGKRRIEVKQ